jgi:hypothetical protein
VGEPLSTFVERRVRSQPGSVISVTHMARKATRELVSSIDGLAVNGNLDLRYEGIARMVQSRHETLA